jgi:MtN3 and saliva related transmembrane protein
MELIGWVSATIAAGDDRLAGLLTWRDRSSQGVSRWLFVGQIMVSVGFVIYSCY